MRFWSWLRNGQRSYPNQHRGKQAAPPGLGTCHPRLEALEDRCLPSGFSQPVAYPAGPNPQAVVTADLNGDGRLDLVTANNSTNGVSVLLGKKNGSFGAAQNYAVGGTNAVAVGDINGDKKPDIVTGNGTVLLGNGDGTFRTGPSYGGSAYSYVALADLNGDSKLDLITASVHRNAGTYATDSVTVRLGNGDGTFQAATAYSTPGELNAVTVADFNQDGKLDLITGGSYNGTVTLSLLPGKGDGTFGTAQTLLSLTSPSGSGYAYNYALDALTVGDFNGDGRLDLAFAYAPNPSGIISNTGSPFSDIFGVLLSSGGAYQLQSITGLSMTNVTALAAADVNHDGKLDLVALGVGTSSQAPELGLLPGKGDGTFGTAQTNEIWSGTIPGGLAVGDFNGDGYQDVALTWLNSNGTSGLDVLLWSNK